MNFPETALYIEFLWAFYDDNNLFRIAQLLDKDFNTVEFDEYEIKEYIFSKYDEFKKEGEGVYTIATGEFSELIHDYDADMVWAWSKNYLD